MKFTAITSTVVLATLVAAQNPDPFISTPTGVTTCLNTALNFGGTHPPFTITALPGGQASGTPIETIVTNTPTSPYSWLVNLAEGTYTTLQIRDSLGNLQYTSPITILRGSDTSCVGNNTGGTTISSGAGGSTTSSLPGSSSSSLAVSQSSVSSTSSASSVASTSSAAGGSSTTSKASTSSAGSTSSTGSTSAAPTSSSGAATHLNAKFGVAGLLGFLGAAVMV